jgi:hypothetical protein
VPRNILFIVNSDPRVSARPAEAIRIAAGVGAWKKVEVTLALCESAVLALSEFPDEFIDEDNFLRYLPIIGEFGRPVYVETGAPLLKDLGEAPVKYERITVAQLAALASASDCVLRF